MKKLLYLCILIIAMISLLQCLSVDFAATDSSKTYGSRISADEIEVYRTQTPNKKFIEIGIVNASYSNDTNELIQALKKKAAENGGDAIIDLEPYPSGMSATVIRYLE
jgi:hypothetical protein